MAIVHVYTEKAIVFFCLICYWAAKLYDVQATGFRPQLPLLFSDLESCSHSSIAELENANSKNSWFQRIQVSWWRFHWSVLNDLVD